MSDHDEPTYEDRHAAHGRWLRARLVLDLIEHTVERGRHGTRDEVVAAALEAGRLAEHLADLDEDPEVDLRFSVLSERAAQLCDEATEAAVGSSRGRVAPFLASPDSVDNVVACTPINSTCMTACSIALGLDGSPAWRSGHIVFRARRGDLDALGGWMPGLEVLGDDPGHAPLGFTWRVAAELDELPDPAAAYRRARERLRGMRARPAD